jgi:two-component system cell cycle sensor histidine kinase/response regulator CckA
MVPHDSPVDDISPASRELDRRARQQADVARLGVLALSGVPIAHLFGEALGSIRAHLGVAFAAVIRMEGDSAQLVAGDGFLPAADSLPITPGSPAALLRATGGPIVVPDLSRETRSQSFPLLESMGAKSGVAVPLRAGGGTIGGLAAGDSEPRDYPVEEVDFLQSVANVVSAAVLRSRQDDELRRSQNRWRTLVETANQGVWTIDPAGRVDYLNARMAELLGVRPEEVLGKRFLRFFTAEERRNPRWRAAPDPGLRDTIEVEIARADGRALRVLMSRSSLVDDRGNQQGALGIVTDITARSEAAESVAASERYFRSLIENSLDSVAILDGERRFTYLSPNVRTVLGYHPDELRGQTPFDILHPDDMRTAVSCVEQACLAPGEVSFARVRFRHKDGTWRWIDASLRNLLNDEMVHGLVLNWHDVTERYQAEQALRQSEEKLRQAQKIEAIGRLAGGIAHDFNNLLTAILTTAQLAAMDVAEGSSMRSDLGEIQQAAERAAGLTRQLLAFSRRQVLRPRTVDLALVVADLEKMLVRLIGEDVELNSLIEPNCNVRADPGQLEQVIMNLALNARDAMPRGGRLTLRTGKVDLDVEDGRRMFGCPVARGSYVRLQVEDTGLGMDESTLQHIFEPFFTTKEMGKGTGLGLATVYGIVKQSGGYIRATSHVGTGSMFEIFLPETSEMADAPVKRLPSMESGKGETVLLVEDEELVRAAAGKALLRSGFHVLEANNGVHALKVYGLARVDLVITDLVMPEMGGRELATRLRQHNPDVKVLFTSGYTDDPTIRGGETARGIAFLPKPFTPESLGQKAREVLDQPRDS